MTIVSRLWVLGLSVQCMASTVFVKSGAVDPTVSHFGRRHGSHRRVPNGTLADDNIFSMDEEDLVERAAGVLSSHRLLDSVQLGHVPRITERPSIPQLLVGFEEDRLGDLDSDVEAILGRMSNGSDPELSDGDSTAGSRLSPTVKSALSNEVANSIAPRRTAQIDHSGLPALNRHDLDMLKLIPPPAGYHEHQHSRSVPLSSSAPSGYQAVPHLELPPAMYVTSPTKHRLEAESPKKSGISAMFRGYNSDGDA